MKLQEAYTTLRATGLAAENAIVLARAYVAADAADLYIEITEDYDATIDEGAPRVVLTVYRDQDCECVCHHDSACRDTLAVLGSVEPDDATPFWSNGPTSFLHSQYAPDAGELFAEALAA